jgi:sodium/bile acid cotransporter 7
MKTFLVKNWFMLGMPVAVALAWVWPDAGAEGGWLRPELTTKLVVMLVFLVQGLTLPGRALLNGVSQGRLHLGVQATCFLMIPVAGITLDALIGGTLSEDLRWGFLYLCVLPSTIMMAVVLATVAGGNVAAAIFNAVCSNVLGVIVTPLWVTVLLATGGGMEGGGQSLGGVLREVSVLLLVPLLVGQVLRQLGAKTWADNRKKTLSHLSNSFILLLVYAAFCDSVQAGIWKQQGWGVLGATLAGVLVLLVLAVGLASLLARLLGLAPPEKIVLIISGSQKSLATGVPLAKIIFGAHPALGVILLPIMIYHPLQLFAGGWLAGRHAAAHPVTDE